MNNPVDEGTLLDVVNLAHVELCAHLGFLHAGRLAREVFAVHFNGKSLREAVDQVFGSFDTRTRDDVQGRLAVIWCERARGEFGWSAVHTWMRKQGYSDTELKSARARIS